MTTSVTLPLGGEVETYKKGNGDGRQVFEYEDGKRTEKPVTDEQGRPLYRHTVLVSVSKESDPEDATLLLPTAAAPPGPRFADVKLAPGASVRISARSQEGSRFAELAFQITGELATTPTPKKSDSF